MNTKNITILLTLFIIPCMINSTSVSLSKPRMINSASVWLSNDSQKPLIYQVNQDTPKQLGHGNRVLIGNPENISVLRIKTTSSVSIPHSLLKDITTIKTTLRNNSGYKDHNAIIIIQPSRLTWKSVIDWEPITSTWTNEQELEKAFIEQAEQQKMTQMATFFRVSSPEQFIKLIINNNILGEAYSQRTHAICSGRYNNPQYNLCANLSNTINRIKGSFNNLNHAQQAQVINQLKLMIDQLFSMIPTYSKAGLVQW